jgi:hypothetical protein
MKHIARASLATLALAFGSAVPALAADPGVTLIGVGSVLGTAFDKSGLQGRTICKLDDPSTCTDQATLGGFGSGMSYTGHDDVFIAVNDRGTFDGQKRRSVSGPLSVPAHHGPSGCGVPQHPDCPARYAVLSQ